MKIAITSNDCKHIDTHFGKAQNILIYEVDNNGVQLMEVRNIKEYCAHEPGHKFNRNRFEIIYEQIKDCEKLYTKKIGDIPVQRFQNFGISVRIAEGSIKKVLGY